jgi:hypothetical protein
MEFSYLVREPGLLDLMRAFGSLPDEDRAKLQAFMTYHGQATLRVRDGPSGRLILESGQEWPAGE